ncbi:hypothetical protein SAMN04488023_12612 [Pedobacter rhizosphaerae]|uniref:Uncharacterized protein n=1 Tax=Pedobacter rhizosphaerae TaxID=390241 RepID=A0A1H9U083_9SPHI|nr:hypothetical protein SAMN04488023_12612 [Pedobacter rhizosphaerae]
MIEIMEAILIIILSGLYGSNFCVLGSETILDG